MKKIIFILMIAAFVLPAYSQKGRPKVGVVLSGGGAKGVAHISCLRAIEEAGLPIDIICGTSMGALVGGLYSIGWSCDELDSLVRSQEWSFLLTDRANPEVLDIDTRRFQSTYTLWYAFSSGKQRTNDRAGLIRGVNLDRLFDKVLEGYQDSIDFNHLPIPFACVATDIVTNTEVDFHSGYLKEAMRASMSIPGVFTPVRKGDQLLVDGGLRNNYPADVARKMGADIIIGVILPDDTLTADDIKTPLDLFTQILDINTLNKYSDNVEMSDVVMHINVKGYSAASFTKSAIDTLLRRGAEEAARHHDELVALHDRVKAHRRHWPTHQLRKIPEESGNILTQQLSPIQPLLYNAVAGVAFRFDNEESGALQIGVRVPFKWKVPQEVSSQLRLGKRMEFQVEHHLYPRGVTSPSLSYTYNRNDVDVFEKNVRTLNIKYNQHHVALMPLNSSFRKYKIRMGLMFDYLDFYDPALSSYSTAVVLDNERLFSYYLESYLNSENDPYTPTSGIHFLASYTYRSDNFISYHGGQGISEALVLWRNHITPGTSFTITPSLSARLLFSEDEYPIIFGNTLGCQQIYENTIIFPGIKSIHYVNPYFLALGLDFQLRIAKNRYIIAHTAAARHVKELDEALDWPNLYGFSLGYCYSSFLGPISLDIGYSTLAPGLNFFLSIGQNF